MSFLDALNMDLYNLGPMDLNSIESTLTGYVSKIKGSENPIVGVVREYWDSALSVAAGYLFSGASAAMIAGGLVVECVSKRNSEIKEPAEEGLTPFEAYLSENANRFVRNASLFFSGLYLTGPELEYIIPLSMLCIAAGGFHKRHRSSMRKLLENESTKDKSA